MSSPWKNTVSALKLAPLYFLILQAPQAVLDCATTFLSVDQRSFFEKALIVMFQLVVAQIVGALNFASVQQARDGKSPKFNVALKKCLDIAVPLLIAALVVGGICALGFMALIVPGFIFMTLYVFTPYFIIEDKMPVLAAMRCSVLLSKKKFIATFWRVMLFGILQLLNNSLWDYFIGAELHATGDFTAMTIPYVALKFVSILGINSIGEVYMPFFFYSRLQHENNPSET